MRIWNLYKAWRHIRAAHQELDTLIADARELLGASAFEKISVRLAVIASEIKEARRVVGL